MPNYDRSRIEQLEGRLAIVGPSDPGERIRSLEMLVELYLQADSYVPALETIEHLLLLPEVHTLSAQRRAAMESKRISCWLMRGETLAALAAARELLCREGEIESTALRGLLHYQCAEALFRLGRLDETQRRAKAALEMADAGGDVSAAARAVNLLGRVAYRLGDLHRARDLYEQAFALYRRLGDDASAAWVRNNLGLIHKNLCEWDAAASHLREALATYRRLGRLADCGPPLLHLGIVQQKSGEWGRALASYREAQQVFSRVGSAAGLTNVSLAMGSLLRLKEEYAESESVLRESLERARLHELGREQVLAMEFLGELALDRGRLGEAVSYLEEALNAAERMAPEGDLVVEIERRRAEAFVSLRRLDEAERACERARRLAEASQDRLEHAAALRVAGQVAFSRGDREQAIALWKRAAVELRECRERFELGKTCLALGRAESDPAEARRHLFRAAALFGELGASGWLAQAESELERAAKHPAPTSRRETQSVFGRRHRAPSLVACGRSMQRVELLARRAAQTELSVLMTGETGTGKELIARTIHDQSHRASQPFVAVNCGALRPELAQSQLFGHRKGAFTGAHTEGFGLVEAAHTGTLFLDEIGELLNDVQVTLLRFLESGEYFRLGDATLRRADVRVLAATNRDLRGQDGERSFRRDLLYRLNEIEIKLPPLRERGEDLIPLARHFLSFYGGPSAPELAADAEALLHAYHWPGNVRELENLMRRLAALHAGVVDRSVLAPLLAANLEGRDSESRELRERNEVLEALEQAAGNKSRAADLLGVSRKTLYARLRRLGIAL